jgi:chemotaxis protein CheX
MGAAVCGAAVVAATVFMFTRRENALDDLVPATRRMPRLDGNPGAYEFTGVIGVSGTRKGIVYFTVPRGMLSVLLMRMQETDSSDETIKDLVGEVANTISGNARRDLGKNLVISVPSVIAREPEKVTTPYSRSYVIPIKWRTHTAKLVVCLE